jgi:hypothetical protein
MTVAAPVLELRGDEERTFLGLGSLVQLFSGYV